MVCRCELDNFSERLQTSNFLSATVLSCRDSSSYRQSGRDTEKTVLSCLAWRCELASSRHTAAGTHMRYGITQCYLQPGRDDIAAFIQAKLVLDLATPEKCKARLA